MMRKPDTTALWEQSLAEVEAGRKSIDTFLDEIIETTKKMIDDRAAVAPEVESKPQQKYDEKNYLPLITR